MKPGFEGAVVAGAVNTPEEYEAWKEGGSSMTTLWDGEFPISKKWVRKHHGEEVEVRYVMDLDDLINCEGIEGMNDYLDAIMGNGTLTDIAYRFANPGPDDDLGDLSVLIAATGVLE